MPKRLTQYETDLQHGTKTCTKCGVTKELKGFSLVRDKKSGGTWFNTTCTSCRSASDKARYKSNAEYRAMKIANALRWQAANKDKVNAKSARWIKNNKEKVKVRRQSPHAKMVKKRQIKRRKILAAIERMKGKSQEEINLFLMKYWTEEQVQDAMNRQKELMAKKIGKCQK